MDLIAQEVEARIVSGELPIGAHLAQEKIADEFGISRTPVREAIRKLQAKGLLELRPHRGAVVKGPTVREVREAYLVRAELEGLAAEIAAHSIKRDALLDLGEALEMFAESMAVLSQTNLLGSGTGRAASAKWARANDLFHEVIQAAAGNDLLRQSIKDLHRTVPRSLTWSALSEDRRLLADNVAEHEVIKQALEVRDAQRARALMRDHVLQAGRLIAEWLERRLSIGPTATVQVRSRASMRRPKPELPQPVG